MRWNFAVAVLFAALVAALATTTGVATAGTGMCNFVDVAIQFCHT